jgi:hypothetical protein
VMWTKCTWFYHSKRFLWSKHNYLCNLVGHPQLTLFTINQY